MCMGRFVLVKKESELKQMGLNLETGRGQGFNLGSSLPIGTID